MCAGVPTVINMLLHQPVARAAERFSCLRIMTCSSAPLSTAQWLRFEEIYGVRLLNLYGSSEMGWICANRHDRRKIGTVGPVVESVELRVVDDSGIACAPGEEGQIIVNAAKAAVGHLRDDGSVEALRGKPLKTRDLGYMDQEGYMRLMGRTDDLIIRGGVKISPLEIEEALAAHGGVLEAVVVGLPDPIYGQQPVGFIVPKSGIRLDEAAILEHCANSLAREKVPKRVFIVEALPRSARGKLLRIKLRSDYRTALQNQ
jgi:acyl-coenzyme A synthetase/AMP-(fatty) acid ligase